MQYFLEQASSYAADIDNLILLIAVLTGFWFIIAEGVIFYCLFKFRKSKNPRAQYITGEKKEEMKWIHLPHNTILICDIVVLVFAIWVWYDIKQDLPKADETIRVIGRQWSWTFVHPGLDKKLGTEDDVATVDELRVKVNTLYHFKLESADVIHDFSVPVFRLKQDAVPGRVITGWFKPTKTGDYDVQCAEMCGIGHGIMLGRMHIQTEEEHNAWLKTKTPSSVAAN